MSCRLRGLLVFVGQAAKDRSAGDPLLGEVDDAVTACCSSSLSIATGRWGRPGSWCGVGQPATALTAVIAGRRPLRWLGVIGYGFSLVWVLPLFAAIVDSQWVCPTSGWPCSH
jgi:hypothetical protein